MAASGWGTAGLIETDNASGAASPQVAVDGSGNAVAVWQQFDGARYNIWANRYGAGTGWGTAGLIETDNAGGAGYPQVAVDGSGNAVAVWFQSDGTRYSIWANRYVAGSGWGTAGLIETDNAGSAGSPQVAVDGSGNAVAVWYQYDGSRYNILANRYVAGTGWGTAGLIETDAGDAFDPRVAVDGSGNAVAVWYQFDGSRNNIWANRYVAGTGWGTAGLIETDNAGEAVVPQVAVDGSGNAVAVWSQSDGSRYNILANRYVAGTGWGTAGLIETDNAGDAGTPQVAVDGSGNAVAVWTQSDGTRNNIWANRYVAGSGWGTAGLIETDNVGDAQGSHVAVEGSGNAVAVWQQSNGSRNNIWANRYVAGTGWGTAGLVETDAGDAFDPRVAVDGSGNAVAVWVQFDGSRYSIWANRLVEDHPPSLSLSSPTDGFSTNRSSVWVAGVTEPGATVAVNGVAVSVASNGSFGIQLALAPGGNLVNATAWDRAGNRASAYVNVTFNDPLPGLEQDLADAQAQLTAAQSRVSALEADANSTQSQLDAAHANLTAAQTRVSTLEASAASTQAALAASQARQATLEANATTAKADLASAQSRISALEANKTAAQAPAAAADNTMALLAMALGVGGLAVGAVALMRGGRGPKAAPGAAPPADPPTKP